LNRLFLIFCASFLLLQGTDAPSFDYDRKLPIDLREVKVETRDGVRVHDVTFANLKGGRTAAYLVEPQGSGKHPAILFLHWYAPEFPTSNRTQFVNEAVTLAKKGVRSLLVETMWSEPTWYKNRKREEDFDNTVHQLKEFRRALDVLLAQPNTDTSRVALVGHDFGMMFGAMLAKVDGRPTAYALQAGTVSFGDWYLYGPKMPEPQRTEFLAKLSVLDPVKYIGAAKGKPVFMQFGKGDFYVSEAKAKEFFDAAGEPKKMQVYDAPDHPHALNEQAVKDRIAWLFEVFRL
jgi:dienelactone hydrolase